MAHGLLTILGLCLVLAPIQAAAQMVRGRVTDESSQEPISGATVVLFNDTGDSRATTQTDETGAFSITIGLSARAHWLRVERAGYATVETQPFLLTRSEPEKVLLLTTRPQVVELEGVTARASTSRTRNYAGFLSRQNAGWGRFLDPDDMKRIRVSRASDLLLGLVPGLDVVATGPSVGTVIFRNRGRVCSPVLVVDGVVYDPRGSGGPISIDVLVSGTQVRAVEVYSQPMFVPAELTLSPFNECGAVVLWTEFGLGTR